MGRPKVDISILREIQVLKKDFPKRYVDVIRHYFPNLFIAEIQNVMRGRSTKQSVVEAIRFVHSQITAKK